MIERALPVQHDLEHAFGGGVAVPSPDRLEDLLVTLDIVLDPIVVFVQGLLLQVEADLEEIGDKVRKPREQEVVRGSEHGHVEGHVGARVGI